jgi:hypothetical protein
VYPVTSTAKKIMGENAMISRKISSILKFSQINVVDNIVKMWLSVQEWANCFIKKRWEI